MDMHKSAFQFPRFGRTVPSKHSDFVLPEIPESINRIDRPPARQLRALTAPLILIAIAAMDCRPGHANVYAPPTQVSESDMRPAFEITTIKIIYVKARQAAILVASEQGKSGLAFDRAGGFRAASADWTGYAQHRPQQVLQILAATKKRADQTDPDNDRVEARVRALTMSLRAELASVRAAAEAAVAEQKIIVEQERKRAEVLTHDLDALRVDAYLEAVEAVNKDEAQRATVEREKAKVERLTREVSSLQRELERLQSARAQAGPIIKEDIEKREALEQELKQQRDRADDLSRETASLKAEFNMAREASEKTARMANDGKADIEQQLALQRIENVRLAGELETARKAGVRQSSDLAVARGEGEKATAAAKVAAGEQERVLKAVRDRADQAESELSAVRETIAQAAQRKSTQQNVPSQYAEPKASQLGRELPPPPSIVTDSAARTAQRETVGDVPPSAVSPVRSEPARPPSAPEKAVAPLQLSTGRLAMTRLETQPAATIPFDDTRLLARANALLLQADISTARPVLEYAFQRGSVRAAFLLAETYDARILKTWKVQGVAGDPEKARELYQRALDGGIEDAGKRIMGLK